jgi:hypothetical protein
MWLNVPNSRPCAKSQSYGKALHAVAKSWIDHEEAQIERSALGS